MYRMQDCRYYKKRALFTMQDCKYYEEGFNYYAKVAGTTMDITIQRRIFYYSPEAKVSRKMMLHTYLPFILSCCVT